jgi:hypothetical protein
MGVNPVNINATVLIVGSMGINQNVCNKRPKFRNEKGGKIERVNRNEGKFNTPFPFLLTPHPCPMTQLSAPPFKILVWYFSGR